MVVWQLLRIVIAANVSSLGPDTRTKVHTFNSAVQLDTLLVLVQRTWKEHEYVYCAALARAACSVMSAC